MIERRYADLVFYHFESLARYPQVVHAITGRAADPGRHPKGLNLSFVTTDHPADVVAARQQVCTALGLRLDELVVPRQVHGKRVRAVGSADRGRGAFERESGLPDTDGLTTADEDVLLFISAADCVPLLFFDPVRQIVGAAHAGWRGTVAKIAAETVASMAAAYGTEPQDLLVGIGPSIGPCCYAVGEAVVQEVVEAFGDGAGAVLASHHGATHFDLWAANRVALIEAGVRPENVELADLCTACRTDLFFSHRGERGQAGRFGAFIARRGKGSGHGDRA